MSEPNERNDKQEQSIVLLPCPHCGCGGEVVCEQEHDHDGSTYTIRKIQCMECNACGNACSIMEWTIDAWNTRCINGHRVTFKWDDPGVVGPNGTWVVVDSGYMSGPCEDWQLVEKLIREEWKHDRNLVG